MAGLIKGFGLLADAGGYISSKAKDLIDEISEFADVDSNGMVSVFHRTSKENADKIRESGIFTPKEDGIFFSTKRGGANSDGYGDEVIELKIPADKLELDDIFDGEAHLRLPAKANKPNDVSEFIPNKPLPEPSGLLDMSTPARTKRGSDQGFNMESPLYHASKQDIDKFVAGYDDGLIFLTPNPEFANNWLGKGKFKGRKGEEESVRQYDKAQSEMRRGFFDFEELDKLPSGPEFNALYDSYQANYKAAKGIDGSDLHSAIYPVVTKAKKTFIPHEDYNIIEELLGKEYMDAGFSPADGLPTTRDAYKSGNYLMYEKPEVVEFLKSKGYDSMMLKESTGTDGYSTMAVFDPKDIRSKNAQFDPSKADSGSLSASNPIATTAAGVGGLLAMSASDDSEAGVVGKLTNSLFGMLDAGKKSGEVVTYPDEWIEQVPYELRKEVANHNEGILGTSYREGMEASPTFYRGGGTGRSELKPDTWMSTDPHQASTYAGKYGGGNVMPLKVSKDNVPEVYSNSPEWNRIGLYDSDIKIPANEYPEGLGYTVFGKEPDAWETTDTNILADWAKKNGFGGIGIKGLKDVGPYQRGADLTSLVRAESLSLGDPSKARSVNAVFDPAKASSSNLLASKPAATIGAGILGAIGASQSGKTYADYSPSNLARLQNDDVGGYQAPFSGLLARAAMGANSLNDRGVDDPLMQFVAPRLPSELMGKIAYNDKRGASDYLKAAAGLLGLY